MASFPPTRSTTPLPDGGAASWVVVRPAAPHRGGDRPPRLRRVVVAVVAAAVAVLLVVALVGLLVSRRAAEREAVRDAAELTDVLAESVVQPVLTDAMATDTASAAALDGVVRTRVLTTPGLVRVKVWSPRGEILWSDEPRLVGRTFDLGADAREALSDPQVSAEVSDLSEPENRYERGRGKLLEVHRPVYTPSGHPVLFETYFEYDRVAGRAREIWRGFAPVTLGSLGLLVLLLVPLGWALVRRTRHAQRQREELLERAMDASLAERRRIAATLHDGVVQELVGASFVVGAGAGQAAERGDDDLAGRLRDARDAVRSGIGGLRSLLVDLYPPNLHEAGLPAALDDLVAGLRFDEGTRVDLDVDPRATRMLPPASVEAVFRVAQEALRNAAAHAHATRVTVGLAVDGDDVVLDVADDGRGLDPVVRRGGHFGLALMADVAGDAGAELALRTAPGAGTAWRLRLPAGGGR